MTIRPHFRLTSFLFLKVAQYVGILANTFSDNMTQGEYTTGWTGQGASKSDKKVN